MSGRRGKLVALVHVARGRLLERGRRWGRAALAYEAAVERDPSDARWHARLGRARSSARQWQAAADAMEAALALDDRNPAWHGRLAGVRERLQQWSAAAAAYEGAVARDPGSARWQARLGRARTRAQQWSAAAEAYEAAARADGDRRWSAQAAAARERARQWEGSGDGPDQRRARKRARFARDQRRASESELLNRDPAATDLDRVLLAASPDRLPARRMIAGLVADRLEAIRAAAEAGGRAVADARPRVFTYWAQGIERAPAVVRLCHDELRRLHGEEDVVVIDAESLEHYVALPAHVADRLAGDHTKLSDMLRLELLSSYGGVWMDATCLPRVRVLDVVPELLGPSGFFAFSARRARPTSWFLASEPDHYLVAMMREAHYEYWRHHDEVVDYFLFHHVFEALYHVDARFRALWDATPTISRKSATALRSAMLGPDDPERVDALLDGCFVHKLTYKFEVDALRPGSVLARLLRDGAVRTAGGR